MEFAPKTCCEKMAALEQALNRLELLLPDLVPLIAEYALGHKFVLPIPPDSQFPFRGFLITLDALQHAIDSTYFKRFVITWWEWRKMPSVSNLKAYIYLGDHGELKKTISDKGTILFLTTSSSKVGNVCIVGLDKQDEVRVALFLHKYGNFAVRQTMCPVYAQASEAEPPS